MFIGIESPDEASLKETRKIQNLRQDMLTAVRTIYAHGIDVMAGFIVGFDNDTPATFDLQYRFITESGIQVAMVGLLTALPHTPPYARLEREGRLLPRGMKGDNTKPATNILPRRMDYDDMVRRYEALFRRLFRPAAIGRRIVAEMRHLRRPVPLAQYSPRVQAIILGRLLLWGILPGGPLRLLRFLHTLGVASTAAWPQLITDWIAGLAMRDYVRRHFNQDPVRTQQLVRKTADWLRKRYAVSPQERLPKVTAVLKSGGAELQLILRGHIGRIVPPRADWNGC